MPDRTTLLTIETIDWGGIPTMVDAIYHLLEDHDLNPVVLRTRSDASKTRLGRLWETLTRWRPVDVIERENLNTRLLPTPPFPIWLLYLVPQYVIGPAFADDDRVVVVSGSAHAALPLALRGIPYVIWVATPYEDELRAKVDSDDEWAKRTLSGLSWRFLQWQERFVLERAVRVLALSYTTADRLRQIAPRATGHIETMLFPINTGLFKPDQDARANSPYGRYLLFTARINDPRKNTPMLLRAFQQVRESEPDLRLVLAGEFPDERIRQLSADLGLTGHVDFLGPVPPRSPELVRLYQGATLFVLPSTQEGLGISMLEAIACGAPIIATPCGGPAGIVVEGETGIMTDDLYDSHQFADAILRLLADPAEYEALRKSCIVFAESHFAREVVADQLYDAYQAAGSTPHRPGTLRIVLAAGWAVFIFAMYLIHQWVLRGAAILDRFF